VESLVNRSFDMLRPLGENRCSVCKWELGTSTRLFVELMKLGGLSGDVAVGQLSPKWLRIGYTMRLLDILFPKLLRSEKGQRLMKQ
jgi:hypothetical protein